MVTATTVCSQTKAQKLDSVQQLFLDKIKEYKQKSESGNVPGMTAQAEKDLHDELERLKRVYGGSEKVDLSQFPKFNFEETAK